MTLNPLQLSNPLYSRLLPRGSEYQCYCVICVVVCINREEGTSRPGMLSVPHLTLSKSTQRIGSVSVKPDQLESASSEEAVATHARDHQALYNEVYVYVIVYWLDPYNALGVLILGDELSYLVLTDTVQSQIY